MSMIPRVLTFGEGKCEKTVTVLDNEDFKDSPKAFSLVRSVTWKDGTWVWVKDNYPDNSRGQFYQDDAGKGYILIVTKSEIADVYEIAKLDKYVMVNLTKNGPKYDGRGRTPQEQITLKQSIATALDMHYKLTPSEEAMQQVIRNEERQKRLEAKAALDAQRQVERDAQKAERNRIKALLLARPRLKGYAGTTAKYFNGTPVVGDEWQKLEAGMYCVEVSSYNDEDKTYGQVLGCFIIKKEGTLKSKKDEDTFSFNQTGAVKMVAKSIGELNYKDSDDDFCQAFVYRNMEAVQALQKAGLNSGRIVAVPTTEQGYFQLVKVTAKALTDVNKVKGVFVSD